jgi:hypothetical protein
VYYVDSPRSFLLTTPSLHTRREIYTSIYPWSSRPLRKANLPEGQKNGQTTTPLCRYAVPELSRTVSGKTHRPLGAVCASVASLFLPSFLPSFPPPPLSRKTCEGGFKANVSTVLIRWFSLLLSGLGILASSSWMLPWIPTLEAIYHFTVGRPSLNPGPPSGPLLDP